MRYFELLSAEPVVTDDSGDELVWTIYPAGTLCEIVDDSAGTIVIVDDDDDDLVSVRMPGGQESYFPADIGRVVERDSAPPQGPFRTLVGSQIGQEFPNLA
ncbi:hypothetical protein OCAE111667_26695 [Occultella aeris]|uniref:Uncharacterized protein n=1 Tax=Occultella aeris TaxID=2761496 RepID=A0A7M4DHD1_9MICO|nr:hypothetical protein [Occultella aeris]VZO36324.1 hypothetical protein HALOF300_01528 [Occultella aeris]